MAGQAMVLTNTQVLCVDDNRDILALLRFVLERNGAEVTQCLSAELAIEALRKTKFDVIISDLSMPPGLDGYDLAHALRSMENNQGQSATPALALSADAERPSAKKRFADFQVYLLKPFDPARLVNIVQRLAEADGEAVKAGTLAQHDVDKTEKNNMGFRKKIERGGLNPAL